MAMISTPSDLIAAAFLRTEIVSVGDNDVQIQELSLNARDAFQDAVKTGKQSAIVISVLRHGVLDGSGKPLLTDDDAAQLAGTSPRMAEELTRKILDLSGLGDDDEGNP